MAPVIVVGITVSPAKVISTTLSPYKVFKLNVKTVFLDTISIKLQEYAISAQQGHSSAP